MPAGGRFALPRPPRDGIRNFCPSHQVHYVKNLLSKSDLARLLRELEERVQAEMAKRAAAAKAKGERPARIDEPELEAADIRREVSTPDEIASIRETLADLRDKLAEAEARSDADTDTDDDTNEIKDVHARIDDLEAALDAYGDE